jgi:hypothetical protein
MTDVKVMIVVILWALVIALVASRLGVHVN